MLFFVEHEPWKRLSATAEVLHHENFTHIAAMMSVDFTDAGRFARRHRERFKVSLLHHFLLLKLW
jgi:hypothetical protein